jgi:hypothetical protein
MNSLEPRPVSIGGTTTTELRTVPAKSGLRIRHHATYLIIALAVLLFGALLKIDDQNRVVIPAVDLPLPGICISRQWFGLPCPGCGLTRGCIALMHGQWQQAWIYNPGIFLVLLLVVVQVPYRVIQMKRVLRGAPELEFSRFSELLLMGTVLLLFVQWITRMLI